MTDADRADSLPTSPVSSTPGFAEGLAEFAVDAAGLGVWSWDRARDVVAWSPTQEALHGLAPRTFAATYAAYLDCVHPEDRERVLATVAEALATGADHRVEYRAVRPDGTIRWIVGWGRVLRGEGGEATGIVGVAMDASAQKESEAALREGERRFRASFEQAAVGMALATLDGRITRANGRLLDLLGYSPAGPPPSFRGIVHPADLPDLLERFGQLAADEIDRFSQHKRFLRRDGTLLWAATTVSVVRDDAGRPASVVAVLEDVTARKEAEAAMRDSEELFRATFDHAAAGMALCTLSGEWIRVNPAFAAFLGYTPATMPPSFQAVTYPPDLDADLDRFRRLIAGEIPRYQIEKRYLRADGSPVWAAIAVSLSRDAAGQPRYTIGVIEDISERKRDEDRAALLAAAGDLLADGLADRAAVERFAALFVPGFADACVVHMADAHGQPAIAASEPPLEPAAAPPWVERALRGEPTPDAPDAAPPADDPDAAARRARGWQRLVALPLQARGRVLGTITLAMARSGRRFTAADDALAREVARRLASAVDNARLLDREQEARRRAEAGADRVARLQRLTASFAGAMTPAEVGGVVVEEGTAALGAAAGSLALVTDDRSALRIVRAAGYADAVLERYRSFPLDAPIALAEAARTGETVLVPTRAEFAARYPDLVATVAQTGARAVAAIPVVAEGRVVAAIGLSFAGEQPFDHATVGFMRAIAHQAALALERARLYEAERRARDLAEVARGRLAFLAEASALLGASLDRDETMRRLAGLLAPRLSDWAMIHLADDDGALRLVELVHPDPAKVELGRALLAHSSGPERVPRGVRAVHDGGEPILAAVVTDEDLRAGAADDEHLGLMRAAGIASGILVPLVAHGRRLGVITLVRSDPANAFGPDDLAFAADIADRAAVALANAGYYLAQEQARREAEQATERMRRLQEGTAAMAGALTPAAVAAAVVDRVAGAIGASSGVVALAADDTGERFRLARSTVVSSGLARRWAEFTPDAPFALAAAIGRREPVLLSSVAEMAERFPATAEEWRATGNRSYAALPLLVGDRALGAVGLAFRDERRFAEEDVAFLQALARQAAQALERTRLLEAERAARAVAERATERTSLLQSVTAALSEALTPNDVAGVLLDNGVAALGAASGAVGLLLGDGRTIRLVRWAGYDPRGADDWERFPIDAPIPTTEALRTGLPVLLGSAAEASRRFPDGGGGRGRPVGEALACTPLVVEGRAVGVLALGFAERRAFSDDDVALLLALSRQGAQAMERARLFEAERRARDQAEAAEAIALRETGRLAALANLSRAFTEAGTDFAAAVETVARITAELTGDCAVVRLLSDDEEWADIDALHHPDPARRAAFATLAGERHGADEVFAAEVLAIGEPLLLADVTAARDVSGGNAAAWERLAGAGVTGLLIVPLRARGRSLGALSLLRDRAGTPFGPDDVAFVQEVADRAGLAIDNARLYREARAAVRARDEFLSVAAHELRTPVTTVKGYAQMLLRARARGGEDARTGQFLAAIDEATDRLRLLADDLLDVSRLRLGQLPLRPREVDVADLARAAAARFAEQGDAVHPVRADIPRDPALAWADPDRIDQILSNLLGNAAKYSPAGGEIAVVVRPAASPEPDPDADPAPGVLLSIADRGIGIPAGETETIFEPFNRAENATRDNLPGLGLGLSICRSIAERHGGRIWAESAGDGRGTTFRLWLPSLPPAAASGDG